MFLGKGRDDDGGYACSRSPAVAFGWGNVIPKAAVFVVGNNDGGFFPNWALFDFDQDFIQVLVAGQDIGIAWVFI